MRRCLGLMRCGEERTQDCVQSLSRWHLSGQMSALQCLPFYRSPHRSGRSRSRKGKEGAVSPRFADRMSVSQVRRQVLLRGCLSISVSSCWALCDPGSPFFVHGGASVSGLDHCPAVIVLHASLHSPPSASARDCYRRRAVCCGRCTHWVGVLSRSVVAKQGTLRERTD